MSEGEARYAVVVDNGPTAEPYFAETWGCCPSRLDAATQDELRGLAIDALKVRRAIAYRINSSSETAGSPR